jgi:hypothetical protein
MAREGNVAREWRSKWHRSPTILVCRGGRGEYAGTRLPMPGKLVVAKSGLGGEVCVVCVAYDLVEGSML